MASLSALISKISNSEEVEDHIQIMSESLEKKHLGKQKPNQFLSTAHLKQFSNYLTPISQFSTPLPKHNEHYEAVKESSKRQLEVIIRMTFLVFSDLNSNACLIEKKFYGDRYLIMSTINRNCCPEVIQF